MLLCGAEASHAQEHKGQQQQGQAQEEATAPGQVLKEIANASAEAGQWENKLKESNLRCVSMPLSLVVTQGAELDVLPLGGHYGHA